MRRPRDWCRVVGVQSDTRRWSCGRWLQRGRMFEDALPVLPVQLKPKRFAEGRQRPFCGIGLSRLESNVVHFTRRVATALAGTMAFTDDRRAIGLHGNAHLGDVDR